MAKLGAIARELSVAVAGLEPEAMRRELAAFARRAKAEALGQMRARRSEPTVRTFVNGREGADESSVQMPGPIVYQFDYAREIVAFALDAARRASPVASGAYRNAWFAMVNGRQVDPKQIPAGAEVMITNDRPYARKIHVGAMRMSVPPGIVERVRQVVQGRYGNVVTARVRFVALARGYVLKGRAGGRTTRADRKAGQQMAYPALVLVPR